MSTARAIHWQGNEDGFRRLKNWQGLKAHWKWGCIYSLCCITVLLSGLQCMCIISVSMGQEFRNGWDGLKSVCGLGLWSPQRINWKRILFLTHAGCWKDSCPCGVGLSLSARSCLSSRGCLQFFAPRCWDSTTWPFALCKPTKERETVRQELHSFLT